MLSGCGDNRDHHLFILSGQSNMAGLDPRVSFIPAVSAAFGRRNITVVKDAQGGQPIRRWDRDWQPADGGISRGNGDLYERLMLQVRAESNGRTFKTVSFIWMQGESDAQQGHGEVYRASLERLIGRLRDDLGRDDLRIIIGRLSDFDMRNERYPHWTMVRRAQEAFAESESCVVWINTDDLNDGLAASGAVYSDDLHYSTDGYETLGVRFAQAAIRMVSEEPAGFCPD